MKVEKTEGGIPEILPRIEIGIDWGADRYVLVRKGSKVMWTSSILPIT